VIGRCQLGLALLLLVACGSPDNSQYQVASGKARGKGDVGIVVSYGPQRLSIAVDAFAAGSQGDAGAVEVRGPLHLICEGPFVGPQPLNDSPFDVFLSSPEKEEHRLRHLPLLVFPTLRMPKGTYTFELTRPRPSPPVRVVMTLAQDLSLDAQTGLYRNDGCTEIADSAAQRASLVTLHLTALGRVIPQAGDANFQRQAGELVSAAAAASAAGDLAAAANYLDRLQTLAGNQPQTFQLQVVARVARETAALLRQTFS